MTIRPGVPDDLGWIAHLISVAPGAAPWLPEHDPFLVAAPAFGFLCWRKIAADEFEILNLAVSPDHRRGGIARALLDAAGVAQGTWFLEVRASNHAARTLYEGEGFRESGIRKQYYRDPPDDAIVLVKKQC